jgi:anti-anti-sigma regulatory factor
MGKVPGEKAAWGSLNEHPERRTYDGILVLRLDVPLFWANASEIHDRVLGTVESHPGTKVVLLDLEATSQLDTTSIDMLELVLTRLREQEIDLYLVRVFYRARLTLAKAGFIEQLGEDHMWHSISAGVRAARATNHLTGKSHTQAEPRPDQPDSDEDFEHSVEPGEERIVVDHDVSAPTPSDIDEVAPRGGYQDPERHGRRSSSRYPRT